MLSHYITFLCINCNIDFFLVKRKDNEKSKYKYNKYKLGNSILLNMQVRQKRMYNPSHFNVFDLDNMHFFNIFLIH